MGTIGRPSTRGFPLPGEKWNAHDDARRRGVLKTVIEMALWEAYGSKSEYLAAPPEEVQRVALALEARAEAMEEQGRKISENSGGGGSAGAGNGSMPGSGGRTTTSAYYP